jgi:hypothetical protein
MLGWYSTTNTKRSQYMPSLLAKSCILKFRQFYPIISHKLYQISKEGRLFIMAGGQPGKKHTTARKTGFRRSHHVVKLARTVNGALSKAGSKVKAYVTRRESGKKAK